MSAVFDYEDIHEAHLNQLEAKLNSHDPTGSAARVIMPPKRQQALQDHPMFYNPEQHAKSPHISIKIRAPSTMSLSKPFIVTSTLTHHTNPSGNPENKPVTFDIADIRLHDILDNELLPWLIMHRTANGELKELDDDHDTCCFPFDSEEGLYEQVPIAPENGFVSLAVGESVEAKAELRYTGKGVDLEKGEKYCLNFRGSLLHWWRFGSLEDLKEERKASRAELGSLKLSKIILAASNLDDFTVKD
ncbi:MAG: hypothetical protein Q9221_008664 [Calogaya cf. arnoldii]